MREYSDAELLIEDFNQAVLGCTPETQEAVQPVINTLVSQFVEKLAAAPESYAKYVPIPFVTAAPEPPYFGLLWSIIAPGVLDANEKLTSRRAVLTSAITASAQGLGMTTMPMLFAEYDDASAFANALTAGRR